MEPHESPQSKKVVNVVITLPPPDNPSLGKTITSITVSDSVSTPPQQPHHSPQHLQIPIGLPIPTNPEHQTLLKRSIFGTSTSGLGLVSVSLVSLIFFLWVSGTPNTLLESHNPEADDDQNSNGKTKLTSFIFPLYPKLGIQERSQRDVELKLGRFVDFNEQNIVSQSDDGVQLGKTTKTVSKGAFAQSTTILPARGNVYPHGLYYTYMLVGSPPRPYFLDMDTGSDLAWIQCDAPCTSCAKGAHPLYKPTKGNIIPSKDSLCAEVQRTQRNGYCDTCHQCDYEVEYADHSSSIGVLARDELHLMTANGSVIKFNVAFGCAYDQQGLLLKSLAETDGILGLSRAKVSLPYQLASQGIIKNVIGHCLTSDTGGGSYMFLGNDFVPHKQMAWVPMINNSDTNLYLTDVAKMTYGNKLLSLDGVSTRLGRAVFDSGSSYTYFPKQAYSDLLANLKGGFGEGLVQDSSDTTLPICWQSQFPIRSIMDVKRFFKPLTLEMGRKWWMVSTKLRIPPEGYMIISNKGNVCLGILDGSKAYDGSTIILGDISLHGKLVVYDNLNHKIGWMQSDCVKPLRFNTLPFV